MKNISSMTMTKCLCGAIAVAILLGNSFNVQAAGKAVDPAGAPSTGGAGGTGGGSGGGGGNKPVTKPAPQPILVAPLTFVCAPDASGNMPVCTGSYQIDPYYPTLSLMTVNVHVSSVNVPDGTALYVTVNLVGYGYPASSNIIVTTAQSGSVTLLGYIAPGSVVQSVVVTYVDGNVVAVGN